MRIIRSGTKYSVYDNGIETYDQLPVGTYAVGYNQNEGCYLIRRANIEVTEKTYGVHNQKVEKVMNAYRGFERSLGVILSGDKGIGKSLFAKKLCENAVQTGYPIVIIDACLPGIGRFIESIERMMSTYGVSAPGIYNTQIIWAGSDPNQSEEDSILGGEKSAIYYCDLEMFAEDDYEPGVFCPDMYVHDPITNGEAWAWIDKNKAPDSSLYLKVGDEVKCIAQGVITYALGDDMLVFGQDGGIYAYFYEEDLYARLNRPGERGIMPVVSGRRVVWFNKSADGDALEYLSLALREE